MYLVYLLLSSKNFLKSNYNTVMSILALIVLEIISGAGMAYFSIPSFLQPLHLLIAFLIFKATFGLGPKGDSLEDNLITFFLPGMLDAPPS